MGRQEVLRRRDSAFLTRKNAQGRRSSGLAASSWIVCAAANVNGNNLLSAGIGSYSLPGGAGSVLSGIP